MKCALDTLDATKLSFTLYPHLKTTVYSNPERTKQMEPILKAKVKIFFKSENLKKMLLIKKMIGI